MASMRILLITHGSICKKKIYTTRNFCQNKITGILIEIRYKFCKEILNIIIADNTVLLHFQCITQWLILTSNIVGRSPEVRGSISEMLN